MQCPKCQAENLDQALSCCRCGGQLTETGNLVPLVETPTLQPTTGANRFKAGELILRRYRITGELGQGGMGVVYKCFDEVGGIDVALKALPPALSHNTGEMEEVRDNFQLVSKLAHPNIATVRSLEWDEPSGNYYLILECAEGMDLRRWRKQKGGKVSLVDTLPVLQQVAQALDYAHSRKIIHRDIKPGNVMVGRDGTVKVLDSGLAAQIQSLSRVKQAHYETSGTAPYMAPEQWRGQYQGAATDQYALAVMAYELLAGRLPFNVPDLGVMQQAVLTQLPERPDGLSDLAWSALACALAKNHNERFPSCAEFVAALAGKADEKVAEAEHGIPIEENDRRQPISELEPAVLDPSLRGAKRISPDRILALTVIVLLFTAVTAAWYFGKHLPAERRRIAEQAQIEAKAREAREARKKAETEAAIAAEEKLKADEAARVAEAKRKAEEAARPKTLIVPDQFSTIQRAILAAKAGDTVRVKGGVYLETLRLAEGVRLIGEGKDLVRVRTSAKRTALNCDGIKEGFVSGFTFEHLDRTTDSSVRMTVVSLRDGCSVELTDCRVRNGDGHGVTVKGASPKITDCILQRNGWCGIYVEGSSARPIIRLNNSHGNEQNGISFDKGASGEAQENICENNKWSGITADGFATASMLRANQCRGNGHHGIYFQNGAVGETLENVCENNKWCGIIADGFGTAPVLRANQCRANEQYGICFQNFSSGEARENLCESNKWGGIGVHGSGTAPKVSANDCRNNTQWGIWCQAGSNPSLRDNRITGNTNGGFETNGVLKLP